MNTHYCVWREQIASLCETTPDTSWIQGTWFWDSGGLLLPPGPNRRKESRTSLNVRNIQNFRNTFPQYLEGGTRNKKKMKSALHAVVTPSKPVILSLRHWRKNPSAAGRYALQTPRPVTSSHFRRCHRTLRGSRFTSIKPVSKPGSLRGHRSLPDGSCAFSYCIFHFRSYISAGLVLIARLFMHELYVLFQLRSKISLGFALIARWGMRVLIYFSFQLRK